MDKNSVFYVVYEFKKWSKMQKYLNTQLRKWANVLSIFLLNIITYNNVKAVSVLKLDINRRFIVVL